MFINGTTRITKRFVIMFINGITRITKMFVIMFLWMVCSTLRNKVNCYTELIYTRAHNNKITFLKYFEY